MYTAIKWGREESQRAIELHEEGKSYREIADILNHEFGTQRTRAKVKDAFNKYRVQRSAKHGPSYPSTNAEDYAPQPPPSRAEDRVPQLTEQNPDGSTTIKANRPFSVEEMAEAFDIDMEQWEPQKVVTNTWGNNWQSKVWWIPNELNIVAANWHDFLAEVRKKASNRGKRISPLAEQGSCLYELALYDAHLGALAWGEETGEDYNLQIAVDRYEEAFRNLVGRMPPGVEKILHIVGQDLFHFDSLIQGKGGATAKGTPQDVDTRWQKLFITTCDMLRNLIEDVSSTCPVDVVVVAGNHDTQTTFYAGEYLAAYFADSLNVRIDNSPKQRKYYRYGDVLLGFAHGDNEKAKDLYRLMTEEAGLAKWREWHRGHRHSEECSEDGRMRIRTMPPLSGKESWHYQQGFESIPGARGLLWHPTDGLQQQIYHNVDLPILESSALVHDR